ncbi:MAG: pyridoxamine kinase [Clostridia bacterium]|nr:pyridoxamine kinase [Clostridia bacterium]
MEKKIAAINDISCLGKCSLTVALPILSCGGFETCPVPTALLSTHTGGFENFTFKDLTEDVNAIANHWKTLNVNFDAVYSGYLGSFEQIEFTKQFLYTFGKNALKLVDPVMGDNGRLYTGFDAPFVAGMRELCKNADIIVPNITEAAFLTDTSYLGEIQTKEEILELLTALSKICNGTIILTGVSFDKDYIGAGVYKNGETKFVFAPKENVAYHGTGDVFASTLLCGIMKGFSPEKSTEIAVNFTVECIKATEELIGKSHYGVSFEACLEKLIKMLK